MNHNLLIGIFSLLCIPKAVIQLVLCTGRQRRILFQMHHRIIHKLVCHRNCIFCRRRKLTLITPAQLVNINSIEIYFQIQCCKCRTGENLRIINTELCKIPLYILQNILDIFFFRVDIVHFVHYKKEPISHLLAALLNLLRHITQQVGIIIGLQLCAVENVQNQAVGTALQCTISRVLMFLIARVVSTRSINQFQCCF